MQKLRNELAHWGLKEITDEEFENYWNALETILKGLQFDVLKIESFKSAPLTREGSFWKEQMRYRLDELRDFVHKQDDKVNGLTEIVPNLSNQLVKCSAEIAGLNQSTEDIYENFLLRIHETRDTASKAIAKAEEAKAIADEAKATSYQANMISEEAKSSANEAKSTAEEANENAKGAIAVSLETKALVEQIANQALSTSDSFESRISEAIEQLKSHCTRSLGARELDMVGEPNGACKTVEQLRVSLAVVSAKEASDMRLSEATDLVYHMNTNPAVSEKTFNVERLLDHDKVTLIRGIAGIGKSSLCQIILSNWIHKQPGAFKYDLVFYVNCAELLERVDYEQEHFDLHTALEKLYPNVFRQITFREMIKSGRKILVLADGIDEIDYSVLCAVKDIRALPPAERVVFDIIKGEGFNKILLGRPDACYAVQQRFLLKLPLLAVEVIGFSVEEARNYVDKFFAPDMQKAESTWNKMRENPSLFGMVRVPIFMSILCSLFADGNITRMPESQTELYVWSYIGLVRRHCQGRPDLKIHTIQELLEDDLCLTALKTVCELAYMNLSTGRIAFEAPRNASERTLVALFILEGKKYLTFHHLTFMEFFASVESLLLGESVSDVFTRRGFLGTLEMYCGLRGASLRDSNSPQIIIDFIQPLLKKCKVDVLSDHPLAQWNAAEKLWSYSQCLVFSMCYEFRNEKLSNSIFHERGFFSKYPYHHDQLHHCFYFLKHFVRDGSDISFIFYPADGLLNEDECEKFVDAVLKPNQRNLRLNLSLQFLGSTLNCSNIKILSPILFQAQTLEILAPWHRRSVHLGWKMFSDYLLPADRQDSIKLNHLSFFLCNLTDAHIKELAHALSLVSEVDLSGNWSVTSEGWRTLAACVVKQNGRKLKQLNLTHCKLSDDSMRELAPALALISEVRLSCDKLMPPTGWKMFSTCIVNQIKSLKLNRLDLSDCHLTDGSMQHLAPAIPLISEVKVSFNGEVTPVGWETLSSCIEREEHLILRSLELSNCAMTDDCLEQLAPAVPLISKVYLSGNKALSPKAWKALSNTIQQQKSLKLISLELSHCNLTDDDMEQLAPALVLVSEVHLSMNTEVSPNGWKVFSSCMAEQEHRKLSKLNLIDCNLTDNDMRQLAPALPFISEVDLSYNREVLSEGWSVLCSSCVEKRKDLKLRKLSLRNCNLNDDSMKELSTALSMIPEVCLSLNKKILFKGCRVLPTSTEQQGSVVGRKLTILECNLSSYHVNEHESSLLSEREIGVCLNEKVVPNGWAIALPDKIKQRLPLMWEVDVLFREGVSELGWKIFSSCFETEEHRKLSKLDLSECNLTDDHIKQLAPALPLISHVNLSGNKEISPDGWALLSACIDRKDVKLNMLNVSDCNLTDDHVKQLVVGLPLISEVDLSQNKGISPSGFKKIFSSKEAQRPFKLQKLHVTGCEMAVKSIEHLFVELPLLLQSGLTILQK